MTIGMYAVVFLLHEPALQDITCQAELWAHLM